MALLVDGSAPSVTDVRRYEGGVVEVATIERIDLEDKCAITREEAVSELLRKFRHEGVTAADAKRIVVTEPLRRWLVLGCLERFYRDAHFNQGNERYGEKWKAYRSLAREAFRSLEESGLGLTRSPMPKPRKPVVTTLTGESEPNTYFIRMTWVNQLGEESEGSDITTYAIAATGSFQITPSSVPDGVTRWNVYVGLTTDGIQRQNADPLPIPGNWDLPQAGLSVGTLCGEGQSADEYVELENRLMRG